MRLEARLRIQSLGIQGNDGYVAHVGVGQGFADHADVVRRPAAAARLGNDDRRVLQIVFSRFQGRNDLPQGHDGRIAGVVVDIGQARVDGFLALMGQELDVVAFVGEGRFEHGEVNRRHRRSQNDVRLLVGLREQGLVVRIGFRRFRARFPVIHDEQEGAQADADGAEVGPFVDFQQCMDFMALSQDFLYLVGDDGVEAAAEGVEFDQFQIGLRDDVLRCPIQAGMVGPLVDDAQFLRQVSQGSDAVFRQDGQAQAVDELRDAVIDFRVDVIGTAAEDDGPVAVFCQPFQRGLGQVAVFLFIRFFLIPGG